MLFYYIMKIALIYFTYDKDEDLLFETITSSKYFNDDNEYDIYVIDDANHPMKNIPDNCIYKQTYWDRGANLTSVIGFKEIIKEYKQIIDKGYDWVIKIDPDTWINNLNFIEKSDSLKYSKIGFESTTNLGCTIGIVQCFSKIGIELIYNFINSSKFLLLQILHKEFPDDLISSIIINNNNGIHKLLKDNYFVITDRTLDIINNIYKIKDLSVVSLKQAPSWNYIKDKEKEQIDALERIKIYKKYIERE